MKSSISDFDRYRAICLRAASEDVAFVSFKRHPDYIPILEHVSAEQGLIYLQLIVQRTPQFTKSLDHFRLNDVLGNPRTVTYGTYGTFSPTTLRYIKVLGDLLQLCGDLRGLRIAEIGAGYGGQCKVISAACAFGSYTLIDLPECKKLQSRYLAALEVPNFRCLDTTEVGSLDESFDLVISNYAFTECNRDVQRFYLDKVVKRSRRGYMTCNFISTGSGVDSMTREELLREIPNGKVSAEEPETCQGNFILTWK